MTKEKYEMKRTNSICPKPEEYLYQYVESNEVFKIEDLVRGKEDLLEHEYGEPYFKTIIEIACSNLANKVTQQTIEKLLELGANPHHYSEIHQGKQALHFAALSQNEQILRAIAKHLNKKIADGINSVANGDTALSVLIKESEEINPNTLNCIRVLVELGIDINKSDKKNISPILHAARKGYRDVIALLVEQNGIDLDSHLLRNKSARDLIMEKNLYTGSLPPPIASNNNSPNLSEIFNLLKAGQEARFIQLEGLENYINSDDGTETMLQICCRLHLVEAAKFLVQKGADTNRITGQTKDTPLEMAAKRGYYQIFEVILRNDYTILKDVLSDLLKNFDQPETNKINFKKCFDLLMQRRHVDSSTLNHKDCSENTPLHYAARYSDPDTTLNLLNKGASLGNSNMFGRLPIEDVERDILEKHFDNCISTSGGKVDSPEFTVTFDYKTLLPSIIVQNSESNMEMGKSSVESSLLNKETNLISEMNVLSYIANSKELKPLLKHPLVTSFLYLKWNRISYFFYTNLILYIAVWISLTPFIFMSYNNPDYENETNTFKAFGTIFYIIIWLTFIILAIKEIFQMVVSPKTYFLQVENLIEIALIISVAIILFETSPSDNTKKQVSAIAILVSAFQLVLLVGQHPKMSTSIVMLRTVSFSFFKFLLWHAILIFAFALSFYTLFNDNSGEEKKSTTNKTSNADDDDDAFNDPGVSLFKTFVMLTGEFDASDINFDTFPVTSRILFVTFIFMIAIVLFNLLNGLAVSDTQLIKNDAEIFAYSSRIEHICYIENMLLGNLIPSKLLQAIKRIFCCCPGCDSKITLPATLAKRACLFPDYLDNYELKIYLNKEGEMLPLKIPNKKRVRLDKKTVRNVRYILKDRYREANEKQSTLDMLLNIIKQQQSQIDELQKGQQQLIEKLC